MSDGTGSLIAACGAFTCFLVKLEKRVAPHLKCLLLFCSSRLFEYCRALSWCVKKVKLTTAKMKQNQTNQIKTLSPKTAHVHPRCLWTPAFSHAQLAIAIIAPEIITRALFKCCCHMQLNLVFLFAVVLLNRIVDRQIFNRFTVQFFSSHI